MNTNYLTENILNTLKDITDWLKFAEAKNTLLITFNSAWLSFFIKKIFEPDNANSQFYITTSIICIVSLIISFISFVPKMFKKDIISNIIKKFSGEISEYDNLLFYKDISKYTEEIYYQKFQTKLMNIENPIPFNSSQNGYEKNLIKQIIVLSKTAYEKYFLFNISLNITIVYILLMLIYFIYCLFI